MKRHLVVVLALVVVPAASFADTVGTYTAGDAGHRQVLKISYRDDQHIRLDVGDANSMLVSGAKAYLLTGQGGRGTLIDMDTLPSVVVPESSAAGKLPDVKIARTGRRETHAGIKGEVYEILVDGEKHEAVLSTDKRVVALNAAFMALARRLGQSLGAQAAAQIELATREAGKQGYGGILRSDQDLVLASVAEQALPADHYALPAGAKPLKLPKMDPAMFRQMQQMLSQ